MFVSYLLAHARKYFFLDFIRPIVATNNGHPSVWVSLLQNHDF